MANSDICLIPGNDDKLLIQLEVIIEEMKSAKPCSIQKIGDDGSILHLCVRYNHFEALKYIVQSVNGAKELLHVQDKEGNTILHWAVNLKQFQTIKFLLSLPEIRATSNTLNNKGFTPLDIMNNNSSTDFIDIAIQYILTESGVQRTYTNAHICNSHESNQSQQPNSKTKKWENLWSEYLQHQGNWIEETRGTLMIVATVIATMTFQSALNPPGGVWQENTLQNKVIMWILTIAMTIAVTFMLLTYMWVIGLVTPGHIYYDAYRLGFILGGAWGVILLVVALIQIVRFVFWIKERKKKKK
ncbi:uncharacterized protein LOC131614715, partial [Vicia villosa]|uniref:uncharacterized protein LOC131614715 n=1 Tax=Vicia villosa TaxID=3911 RepID=UPI00273BA168